MPDVGLMKLGKALALGPVAVLTAAVLAGCSSTEAPKVATAQRPTTISAVPGDTPAPASTKESDYDKALRFTRCMTENGAKIPDPVEGKPLELVPAGGNGFQLVSTPEFEKCRHFLPATWPVKADPKVIAQFRPWAACMRKHGGKVPEMEPDANGMVHSPPDPALQYTPKWIAAQAACRHLDGGGDIPLRDAP